MIAEPLDTLLEKLGHGDDQAAQQIFIAYEPYLRLVVRRMLPDQLRPKFDSVDVVQSVWADVLHGFRTAGWRFSTAAQLKAFLVKAARHRFIDRYRQQRNALERQRQLGENNLAELATATDDHPSAVVQADELWQQMLDLCPPAHRQLLHLKRQGCSLAEIADQTGLHESSVRRILYELARRLAAERGTM
jgi:RNA polymerase sigma-70 factor (ECF subfamily)